MKSRYAWLIGIGVGIVLGYLFGIRQGDIWMGSVLAIVYTVVGYGFAAFPRYRSRWSGPNSTFWYSLVGGLAPLVILLPLNSPLLAEADGPAMAVLLGGLWLGGVCGGIALERKSSNNPES